MPELLLLSKLYKNIQVATCFTVIFLCMTTPSVWSAPHVPPPSPAGGNYLALDGENDYAVLDFDTYGMLFEAGTKTLTVEAWVYPTLEPDKEERSVILYQQVAMEVASNDNPDYDKIIEELKRWRKDKLSEGDYIVGMCAYTTRPPGWPKKFCNSTGYIFWALPSYQWNHVAFQMTGSQAVWICNDSWIDVPWRTNVINDDMSCYVELGVIPHQSFVVGGYGERFVFSDLAPFAGYIDEIRISTVQRYNKAKGDFPPQERFQPDADTVALWHFDEHNKVEIFRDSSGNGYHLVGKNGAAVSGPEKLATTWGSIKADGD